MRPPALFLAGLAAYLPPVTTVDEAVARGWYDRESRQQNGWTGAAVAGDLPPAEMALRASRVALARSGLDPAEVAILLYASCNPQGPHLWCPQHYVERQLIGRDIPAIELRQGCTGMLNAIDLAAGYLAIPGRTAALVTGADNYGFDPAVGPDPLFRWQYAHNATTGRASIFGDAAAAAVLSNRTGFAQVLAIVASSLSNLEEAYRGAEPLFPPSYGEDRPTRLGDRVRDHARLHPEPGATGFDRLRQARTDLAVQVLAEAGVSPDRVTRVLHVHSGTDQYIKDILAPLGIDPGRGMLEFGRGIGHLGASDQLAGLDHLVTSGQVGPGDHVLMISNGTGASLCCAVLAVLDRPDWSTG